MYVDMRRLELHAVCRGLSEVLGVGNVLKHCTYVCVVTQKGPARVVMYSIHILWQSTSYECNYR